MTWGSRSLSKLVISLALFLLLLAAGGGALSTSAASSIRQGSASPTPPVSGAPSSSKSFPDIPLRVMVPAPQVTRQLQQAGQSILDLFPSLDPVASFSPGPRMNLMLPPPGTPGIEGAPANPFRTLAILVKFTDKASQVGASSFDTLIFGTTGSTLRAYYREVSYNQLDIVTLNLPSALAWKTAPQPYSYYTYNNYCLDAPYPHNCQKLAEDVVGLVNSVVDFSQYDNNGDGDVDTVIIVHAGPGAEFTGSPNDAWSHSWETYNAPYLDGKYIRSYTVQPEYLASPGDMTHGVFAHELGHAFGLPDFYDIDYTSAGVGSWSLMSGGSWNGSYYGNTPASLDAWSRLYLQFNTATDVTSFSGTISLPNVEQNQNGSIYRVNTGSEYWLLENRQLIGTDSALPGSGLLIWHVDDTLNGSNRYECKQSNNALCSASNAHFRLALEQADGSLDLEYARDEGDTGDPYPGASTNRTFSASSNPNTSTYYSGSWSGTEIFDISSSASTMTARIATSTQPEIAVSGPGPVNIADGGTYNMGTTTVGVPLTRTITVNNTGTGALHLLTNPPTVTGNFTATSFDRTTLDAGQTATFNLTCTAASAGSPVSGSVSFNNDDGNENPFNFTVTCTVTTSGPPPTLSINDVSVTEGNSGTTNATFTVTLSAASAQAVTVQYATANGTATAGSDYTTTSGTLTFSPGGALTQSIPVPVLGDTLDEPNETFVVNLSNPTNATLADGQGQGTITDDDPPPTLSINDVSVTEGNSGSVSATFTVTLSAASAQAVTVQYATANGTATAGSDYTTTSGTLTFSPGGALTQSIPVPVLGDTAPEPHETFYVNLSNPTNATLADSQGLGTIQNDDGSSVTLLTPPNGSATTNPLPVFSWNPAAGAAKYRLQVDDNANFASPVIDLTLRTTSYTPSADLAPALYSWRVQALGADGTWSSWSAVWTVTIQAAPPVKLTLLAPVKQAVLITNLPVFDWTDAAGAAHYELQVDDSPSFNAPEIRVTPTASTYTAAAPLTDGKYYWRVRACDAAGNTGAWTLVWAFTVAYAPGGGTGEVVIESGDAPVQRAGAWTPYETPLASGGSYLYSSGKAGDVMSLLVTGLQVNVIYVKHPALGSFAVEVDGMVLAVVDCIAPDSVFGAQATINLSAGQHLLRVYPRTGTIAIDAFTIVVDHAQPFPPVEFVGSPPPVVPNTPTSVPVKPTALPTATALPVVEQPALPTVEPTAAPTVVPPTPTPLPVMLPVVDTFDGGTGWAAGGAWRFDPQTAYRGAGWFADSAPRGQISTLTAQVLLDLRQAQNPELSFWQRAALTGGDIAAVDLSLDGGVSWQVVDQQAGAVFEWSPRTVSLNAYRGQVVLLRFRLDTMGEVPQGTASIGWWIDELAVVDAPAITPTPLPTLTPAPTVEPPTVEPPTVEPPTATPVPTEPPTVTPIPTEDPPTPIPTDPPADTAVPEGEPPGETPAP